MADGSPMFLRASLAAFLDSISERIFSSSIRCRDGERDPARASRAEPLEDGLLPGACPARDGGEEARTAREEPLEEGRDDGGEEPREGDLVAR